MKRKTELPNSTQVRMNYTPRSQPSSSSSNVYIDKLMEKIEEIRKLPLEKEVQSKDKRPKVNAEVRDEVGFVEIDDLDNKSKDKRPKFNVEVRDEVGVIKIDDVDNKSKDKRPIDVEIGVIEVDDLDNKSTDKKPKVNVEVGDEVGIIEIDDWDNNCTDFAEELQLQEVLLFSMGFDKNKIDLDLTDTKGKKQVTFSHSKTEPGQSSQNPNPAIPIESSSPIIKTRHASRIPNPTIPIKSSSPIIQTGHTNPIITIDIEIESSSPIRKTGHSSRITENSRAKVQKTYCKICMEATPITKTFTINPCNHTFCNSCTMNYISSKIDQNVSSITCPDPDCKLGFLDPILCQNILSKDVFEKWGLVLCESSLGVNNKFYCPFKDCSALLIDEGVEIINSECPHCHRMFCVKCKVPWHNDLSCSDFQKLGKNGETKEDLLLKNLAKNKKWQNCPQCKMYVEKIDGCMFMKCRCGFCFCYVCATEMSVQTHYCTKCKR